MKIRFRQSGGIAGVVRGCELDTAALSRDEADQLEGLLASVDPQLAPARRAPGADRQQYELVIERERVAPVELSFDDGALTDALAALVAFLRARSRPITLR